MFLKYLAEQVKITLRAIFFPENSARIDKISNEIYDYCVRVLMEDVNNDVGYEVSCISTNPSRHDIDVVTQDYYHSGRIGIVVRHATSQNTGPIKAFFCSTEVPFKEKSYSASKVSLERLKNDIREHIESYITDIHIMTNYDLYEEADDEKEPWQG